MTFVIYPTDDLTSPLREHHKFISFKIGEREMWRLNRSRVRVGNTGNVAIRDLQFKVVCLGDHANYFAEPGTTDFDVRNSVKIEWAEGEGAEYDPYFYCLSPVPKESFDLLVYFDAMPSEVVVSCRQEGLEVRRREPFAVYAEGATETILRGLLKGIGNMPPWR